MPGKVIVTAVSGPIKGEVFDFDEHDTFIFGRAPECHAKLPESDPSTSRHHFMLEVNPPQCRLRDLGSRNGTTVNGVKYGGPASRENPNAPLAVDLTHGDWIQVGRTRFTVGIQLPDVDTDAGSTGTGSFVLFTNPERAAENPVHCAACGVECSHELMYQAVTDQAYYMCEECRNATDPIAILRRMAVESAQRRSEPPAPALPNYEVGRLLGKGGMGAVYEARRLDQEGDPVALKVMLSRMAVDENARKLFEREINVTRSLDHHNIVRLIDHGSLANAFYFAMELCAGGSFATLLLHRDGRLELEEAAPLMLGTLAGLGYAHQNFFVHRDIKPGNILLTEDHTPKLSDFGLAKSFDTAGLSGITMVGNTAGTYCYMSKEQVTNFKWVKPVSDVWSMGAVFYQMLTGELPREEDPKKNPLVAILDGKVIPIRQRRAEIPKPVAQVIDKSLDSRVQQRYQNADEFREALAGALSRALGKAFT